MNTPYGVRVELHPDNTHSLSRATDLAVALLTKKEHRDGYRRVIHGVQIGPDRNGKLCLYLFYRPSRLDRALAPTRRAVRTKADQIALHILRNMDRFPRRAFTLASAWKNRTRPDTIHLPPPGQ